MKVVEKKPATKTTAVAPNRSKKPETPSLLGDGRSNSSIKAKATTAKIPASEKPAIGLRTSIRNKIGAAAANLMSNEAVAAEETSKSETTVTRVVPQVGGVKPNESQVVGALHAPVSSGNNKVKPISMEEVMKSKTTAPVPFPFPFVK